MSGQLDEHVASTIDRHNASGRAAQDDADDAFFDELEHDPALESLREKRMESLQQEWRKQKDYRGGGHGFYTEIKYEKDLMDVTTSTKLCVVQFWKPDFNRCRIMDGHLETLAPLHVDTRFFRINVTNAAFLVTKLQIQVLPCTLSFIDGVCKDRIVGFEGLGMGNDRFTTRDLESRLLDAGVLTRPVLLNDPTLTVNKASSGKQQQPDKDDDDDDDDWD